jgi:hypothetical protein
VDDAGPVDGRESRGDLAGDLPEQRLGDRAEVPEEGAQRPALHELHHHVVDRLPVHHPRVHVEGAHHARVAHLAPDLRLLEEALEEAPRLEEVGVHDLHRHALEVPERRDLLRDPGGVDGPHPAGAELALQFVGAQPRADHGAPTGRAGSPANARGDPARRLLRRRPADSPVSTTPPAPGRKSRDHGRRRQRAIRDRPRPTASAVGRSGPGLHGRVRARPARLPSGGTRIRTGDGGLPARAPARR